MILITVFSLVSFFIQWISGVVPLVVPFLPQFFLPLVHFCLLKTFSGFCYFIISGSKDFGIVYILNLKKNE